MPKTVELPGNRTVEFPDDFTEDRMNVEILHAFPDLAEGGVLEPGIPAPGESSAGKVGRPPTAFEAGQIPSKIAQAQESPVAELTGSEMVDIAAGTFTQPLVELPVVGEEGSRVRGVSKAVSNIAGAMTSPVGLGLSAGAGMAPAIGKVVGPLFGALGVKSGMQKMGEASATGDNEKWWEGFIESLLGAAAFGGETPRAIGERRAVLTPELQAVDLAAREALKIAPERITTTEMPPREIVMEPVGAGANRVLLPKSRELAPKEAEDVFGLDKITELSNQEIAAATETLKTDAPLTAAELEAVAKITQAQIENQPEVTLTPEPAPAPETPLVSAPEAKAPEPAPLDRMLEIQKRWNLASEEAAVFNNAIEAVKKNPERWTTLAEGVQKEALRIAAPAGVSLERTGNLALSKEIAQTYLSEASAGPKALAVGEAEKPGPTTRGGPPPAKAEEGARETAIPPAKVEAPAAKPAAETGKEMGAPDPIARIDEELAMPYATDAIKFGLLNKKSAIQKGQTEGKAFVPYQTSKIGSNRWAVVDVAQGIDSEFPVTIDHPQLGKTSTTKLFFKTKTEAQKAIDAQPKPTETPPTGPGMPTPAEQAEIRGELDDTLGGKAGIPLKPLPPGAGNIPVKGLHEIIQDLAKGLHLPIRFGRLTTTKFAGYFKPVADLIGSRRANDITTISHEVGHKLDKHLKLSSDRSIAGELDVLGDPATPGSGSSWTKSKSHAYKVGEGVGEFVRYWLTDPTEARAKAPKTFAAFETAMNANTDFGDVMRTAQSDIQTWRASPSQARLRSHISVGDNPNKTPYRLRQLTRDLVDDLHILRVAVDDAQHWLGSKLAPTANPYMLARLLRGAYGRADVFVRHGTVDFKTKAVTLGKSLEDALKPIAGRTDEFRDYIVAKRAQELHAQGRNSGLLDQDIQATVQHYANDTAFQKAFDAVKEWQDSLLKYAQDAGLVTADGVKAMRKMNQDYVPFHRLFEIGAGEVSSLESAGMGRGLNLGKPGSLRGLHGSPRPIVDPLETMIKNAYVLTTAAEKQAIHLALADLANSPGMGKWVEKIATPKEMVKVGIEKIRKQLEDAGADLTGVPDDLLLSFFQNSSQAPFGENIIKIVRNGKPEFYRLDRELFDTFHALDLDDAGQLTRILAAPAQLLRSGVILAPDFALANAFRDAFSSAIVGKYTVFPFEATIRGLAAMLRRPQLVEEWKAAGGANVVEASYFDRTKMQKFIRESITSDLTPMEKAVLMTKGPLTFLRWLTGTAEEATRIGEYEVAYKALRKSGMSEGDARTMAAFESRDRQDFAKGGAKTKILRLWTPFWNASLQANVKLAQSFRERPFQTTLKGLAFITTAKVIEQALNWDDEDYWDRPQWERDTFFMIPIGKDQAGKTRFLKLPTPFEPGIIFGTLPGRVFQYLRQHDKRAIDGFMLSVAQQTIPNPIPQGIQVIFEDFLSGSKGWDIFRGRQIVPESIADMPTDLQWTEQTSLTARKIGKLIGLSPMKVDHVIASTSGGLGRQLTHNVSDRLIQLTTGEKPTATSQVPGGRFITVPGGIVSQSVEDFYGYYQKILGEENRFKATGQGQQWAGLSTDFRSAAQQMSKLRAASRATSDPLEKQKFAIQIAEIAKVYAAEARKMGVK